MDNAVIYVHGQGGNAAEADRYRSLFPDSDVIGFDYSSVFPWEAEKEFPAFFDPVREKYRSVTLIANSIGAYFSMLSLAGKRIEKAIFISPVVDMEKLITDMMTWTGVSETELRECGEIVTSFGQTLSWDYLTYARTHPITWTVPAMIIYGDKDDLTPYETVSAFAEKSGAELAVMKNGEHWFHTPEQMAFIDRNITEYLIKKKKMNIELVKLTPEFKDHLFDMLTEWKKDIEENHTNHSPWMIFRNDFHDFDYYLENLEIKEETEEGRVPDTTLFCLDRDRNIFVGAVNIRHYLNDGLMYSGGHIGDGIRPSERRKGYGTAMVALALEECRKLGIKKVLMCCDSDNIGSAKTIVKNGGVFENEVEEDGKPVQRYWITL